LDTAYIALIIIGIALVFYITDWIPIATTSILACLALAIFGVITPAQAFGGFANDMVFLIIGMVIVGNTLFETGVAQIMGRGILRIVGGNEKIFIVVLILVASVPAAFLSNTAAAAMMLPVAASAVAASNGKFTKKNTYMVVGMAAVTSGGLTLVGSTPQLIAQGILQTGGHETMGFFELARVGGPIIVLLIVYYLTIGRLILRKSKKNPRNLISEEEVRPTERIARPPPPPQEEEVPRNPKPRFIELVPFKMVISVAILLFCVVGFITGLWTLGTVAMVGAAACIVTRCITQQRVFAAMDWNSVVVIAASLGLATGLEVSGAGAMIAEGMVNLMGDGVSPWLICAGLALVAIILGNFMSATATAALLVPIAVSIALQMNIDVKSVVMAVVIACNISYATPVSTPPMTMTLSAGYRFMDYVRFGGMFTILAYLLAIALFPLVLNL
jgi:anion transporter